MDGQDRGVDRYIEGNDQRVNGVLIRRKLRSMVVLYRTSSGR